MLIERDQNTLQKQWRYIMTLTTVICGFILAVMPAPAIAQANNDTNSVANHDTNNDNIAIDPAELEIFLDGYLAEPMAEHHIPGVVISVVQDDRVILSKGYGYADLANQTPFDPAQTVLTAASLGKAFTAAALLHLADQGHIDLDEDVRPYIRDFELPDTFSEPLTFAHLLTHTDGFEARVIGVLAMTEADLRPLGEMLANYMPTQLYPPGAYMTYGNFAANLAGYLVAEISGMPFEQYVAENIFTPLGMNDSTFDQRLTPEMRARVAKAYEYADDEQVELPFFYLNHAPEGGLRSTAADINRFMLALLNGGAFDGARILSEATASTMFTQQFTPEPRMAGITYGLFEHFENDQRLLLRDGDGIGTRTRMVLLPEHDLGFVISYNSGDGNLRLDIVSALLDRYFPAKNADALVPVAGFQERVAQFTGTYRPLQADITSFGKSMYFFSQLVDVSSTDDGHLRIAATGMGGEQSSAMGGFEGTSFWVEVEPLYFRQVDGPGQLAFVQDNAGTITQMISGQGYHSPFLKLPWYGGAQFQMLLIELVVLLIVSMLVLTLIIWPVGVLLRRRRGIPTQTTWGGSVARLWVTIVGGMLVLFVLRAIGVLYAIGSIGGMPNFVWGVNDEMISVLNSIYLPVLLALPLPLLAVLAWGNRWWNVWARLHYSLVALAVLVGIWWTQYWNLLGFQI